MCTHSFATNINTANYVTLTLAHEVSLSLSLGISRLVIKDLHGIRDGNNNKVGNSMRG